LVQGEDGFDFQALEKEALPGLVGKNLVEHVFRSRIGTAVRLTRKGILFCDTVSSAFL